MTTLAAASTLLADRAADRAADRDGPRQWLASVLLLLALAGLVAARWLAVTRGLDGLALGTAFSIGLAALWLAGRRGTDRVVEVDASARGAWWGAPGRIAARLVVPIAAGVAFGAALVLVTVAGSAISGAHLPPGLGRPAAPFLPWALVTIAVASAEEGLLRGALFDRLRGAGGLPIAIGVTTLAFALMHVPVYGWHVVPLDLAVGLGLAGLRLATRSIVAPAAAHAVADLATWWL